MKENKRQAIHKRQHTAQPVTHKTLEKLYYIISCRFFFFPAFRKNGKISCIECSICCCSLSLTLPPRAQYYTVLSNFLFCLSLCYFGRRVENRVGFVCVSVNNFIHTTFIHMVEDFIKFPFCFFPPNTSRFACVYELVDVWSRETGTLRSLRFLHWICVCWIMWDSIYFRNGLRLFSSSSFMPFLLARHR